VAVPAVESVVRFGVQIVVHYCSNWQQLQVMPVECRWAVVAVPMRNRTTMVVELLQVPVDGRRLAVEIVMELPPDDAEVVVPVRQAAAVVVVVFSDEQLVVELLVH
jgi:hypothetical protein